MTATHSIAPTLLVAIDISKHRQEVLIGIPRKTRRSRLTVMITPENFRRLSTALASYGLPVRIGFEAIGNYHRTLAHHLGRASSIMSAIGPSSSARPCRRYRPVERCCPSTRQTRRSDTAS